MKTNNKTLQFRLIFSLAFFVFGFFASVPLYIVGLVIGAVAIPKWWEVIFISFVFDSIYSSSVQGFQAEYFLFGLAAYLVSLFVATKTRLHNQESSQFIRV